MAGQTRETIAGSGEHVVQFYDQESDLARAVGRYLASAMRAGEVAVVITTPEHREAFEAELATARVDVAEAERSGRLNWFDAAETLARFMPRGRLDPELFDAEVGGVLRRAAQSGREIRAFGEMVALLWDAGDVDAAIELEKLWNGLARELRFSLWCAYHGHSLQVHERADELHEVCHLHTRVLDEATASFAAGADSPLAARRFVTSVLERRPYVGRVPGDDARLVTSELTTNAVIHACTPFSLSLACQGSTVRISVRDWNGSPPIVRNAGPTSRSGRGLRIVDTVARDWGVEADPDGKTVWAELPLG
jgi:MEDS: MEthanogen/methylotroph, DcmR Sensory domain/Histidine kinase-like ATPase domain